MAKVFTTTVFQFSSPPTQRASNKFLFVNTLLFLPRKVFLKKLFK